MTPEETALARRAVACKGWRWMRGMSNDQGQTIDCVDVTTGQAYCGEWDADMTALPDLTDPATVGCLLTLVREAWKSPLAQVSPLLPSGDWWFCYLNDEADTYKFRGRNEAEALVAALEASPCLT